MNLLFSCVGKRGYIADFFRPHLAAGDRIIGTGNTPWTPGFQACDAAFLLPDIDDDAYIPAVLELCERQRIDAVLSFSDPDVRKLAQFREDFRTRGVVPLFPAADVADIAFDKYRMFEYLTAHGIPTPRTVLTLEEAADIPFPLYVKPRRGSGSRHTFVARRAEELAAFYHYQPDMIVQEAIVGDEFDIELCTDLAGQPVGVSTWRKYRSVLGETEQAETFRDERVIEFALRFGRLFGAVGPMDMDVIRVGEKLIVLEANTRFGGGYPVSHLAGADFPKLLVSLVKHGTAEPNFSFAPGIVMMKRLSIIGGERERFFRSELHVE
jgi:carbamoyl-phosphate synthase large subunit